MTTRKGKETPVGLEPPSLETVLTQPEPPSLPILELDVPQSCSETVLAQPEPPTTLETNTPTLTDDPVTSVGVFLDQHPQDKNITAILQTVYVHQKHPLSQWQALCAQVLNKEVK